MSRRIYKYGTGQRIPEGAKYLSTVTQTQTFVPAVQYTTSGGQDSGMEPVTHTEESRWIPCWLVWHYFLVEVPDES